MLQTQVCLIHPPNASDGTLASYFLVFPSGSKNKKSGSACCAAMFYLHLLMTLTSLTCQVAPLLSDHLCTGSLCLNFLFSCLHLEHLIKQAQLYEQLLPPSDAAKLT